MFISIVISWMFIINQVKKFMDLRLILIGLLASTSFCLDPDWTNQAGWTGSCNLETSIRQSPIDINPMNFKYCSTLEFNNIQFACSDFDNSGAASTANPPTGTAKVVTTDGSLIILDSKYDYDDNIFDIHYRTVATADELQFHAPSEHTLRQVSYPLELQITHTPLPKSQWAAKIEASNVETITEFSAAQIVSRLNDGSSTTQPHKVIISYLFEADSTITNQDILGFGNSDLTNLKTLLDCTSDRFFYTYSGSLTVPPCTEGVQWLVSREPIKISQTQIDSITAIMAANNNRDIQLRYSRIVRVSGTPCYPSSGLI